MTLLALPTAPLAAAPFTTAAPVLSVLYPFAGGTDGADPVAAVVADPGGHLYGTTELGGGATTCSNGCGIVYKLSSESGQTTESVLYRFRGGNDGANPKGALLIDAKGDLFGTTSAGGLTKCTGGCGTVFELMPNSSGTAYTESILYRFTNNPDGSVPAGTLIPDKAGDLFGTTTSGGTSGYGCYGISQSCGTIFELTKTATTYVERVIYTFGVPTDASSPGPNIIADSSGNIYGIGVNGGANGCQAPNYGCGTVFIVSPFGAGSYSETLLFTLPAPNATGPYAVGGLVRDTKGALYGLQSISTVSPFAQTGAAFKLTPTTGSPSGYTETILHNFTGVPDGSMPQATLIGNTAGTLYGTTLEGGSPFCNCGTIFQMTPVGSTYTETILYRFVRGIDGTYPAAPLYEDSHNALYGTTTSGGRFTKCPTGCGTVFKLSP